MEALETPAETATGFAAKLIMFERLWRAIESDHGEASPN